MTEEELEKLNYELITLHIWQLKDIYEEEYGFRPLEYLRSHNFTPTRYKYNLVYTRPDIKYNINDYLENLYTEFNQNRPDDFTGHSLSVGDVIVIDALYEERYYYVDDIGFKELEEGF